MMNFEAQSFEITDALSPKVEVSFRREERADTPENLEDDDWPFRRLEISRLV